MRAFDGRRIEADLTDADGLEDDAEASSNRVQSLVIQAEDPLSDDDRAFIRRIAPPAAE